MQFKIDQDTYRNLEVFSSKSGGGDSCFYFRILLLKML